MGFFDKIGKKATEVYQDAKDKTSVISSEIKLKSKLADEKDRIDQLYEEVGKVVFKEFSAGTENFSNEVSNMCRDIVAGKEKVEEINREILLLKDMKVCPKCQETIPSNSDFCPRCGEKIAKEGIVVAE